MDWELSQAQVQSNWDLMVVQARMGVHCNVLHGPVQDLTQLRFFLNVEPQKCKDKKQTDWSAISCVGSFAFC